VAPSPRNGRPRTRAPPAPLRHRLLAETADAGGDLAAPARLGNPALNGLHAAPQGAANEHGAEQAPEMLVHAAGQPGYPLLISHGGLPQVHTAAIGQGQCQAQGRQAFIAIEQGTTLVMPENGASLRYQDMPARGGY